MNGPHQTDCLAKEYTDINVFSSATSLGAPSYSGVRTWVEGSQTHGDSVHYTNSQLSGYIPVIVRWRTRHTHTDNMQFLVWPVHRAFARQ